MSPLENVDTKTLIEMLSQNTQSLTKLFAAIRDDTEYQKSKIIVEAIQAELKRRKELGLTRI